MTFPPDTPSLSDADKLIANDWAAFAEIDRLADHWARPAWPDGAEAVYWLIPFDGETLRAQTEECLSALLPLGGFDAVPLDGLHMTIHRVAGAVDVGRAAQITSAATEALAKMTSFRLSVGPLSGSPGAIRYTVTPWTDILGLQAQLVAATPGTTARALRPHVSIAYSSMVRPASRAIAAVRDLRRIPPIEIDVTAVELVTLRRSGHTYRWRTEHRIVLSSGW